MVHFVPMSEPYQPHQRAIVFKDCNETGATIGYHATVARVHESTVQAFPEQPDRWVYRVFVPNFGDYVDVVSHDLFVTGEFDQAELPSEPIRREPVYEIFFDIDPIGDKEVITGFYRSPGRDWSKFVFQKRDQPHSTYEVRMSVQGGKIGPWELVYFVPAKEFLNRTYVLCAVAEIVGIDQAQLKCLQ